MIKDSFLLEADANYRRRELSREADQARRARHAQSAERARISASARIARMTINIPLPRFLRPTSFVARISRLAT